MLMLWMGELHFQGDTYVPIEMRGNFCDLFLLLLFIFFSSSLVLLVSLDHAEAATDYGQALSKALLFFEAQRSGKLPDDQRVRWRGNSGLKDGSDVNEDLVGGYYVGGDNVKYGFPTAFALTTLAWGVLEYSERLQDKGELTNALAAVRWGTDYLLKASATDGVLYAELGDGDSDHTCWQRPEDMTTPRTSYKIDADHPGTDLAAETAAALAAASIAFKESDPPYSAKLLDRAKKLHDFAKDHLGLYSDGIPVAKKYYASSGHEDEQLWAAAWLHRATGNVEYLNLLNNYTKAGATRPRFSWDDKHIGVQTLVARLIFTGAIEDEDAWSFYMANAQTFFCKFAQSEYENLNLTKGGMVWWGSPSNNLQYTANALLALTTFTDYMATAGQTLPCKWTTGTSPDELRSFISSQVDYILGENPHQTSYMVGFGSSYPQQVHHRGASMPSIKTSPALIGCKDGYEQWFNRNASNPNILVGGVVGGPNAYDYYNDRRSNVEQVEPSIVTTAPLVGVLTRLAA